MKRLRPCMNPARSPTQTLLIGSMLLMMSACNLPTAFTVADDEPTPASAEADSTSSGLAAMLTLDASGTVTAMVSTGTVSTGTVSTGTVSAGTVSAGTVSAGTRGLDWYRQQNRTDALEANARVARICTAGKDPGCDLRIVAESSSAKLSDAGNELTADTPCPPWKACSDSTAVYVDEYEYKVFRVEVTDPSFSIANDKCTFAVTLDDADPSTGQSGEVSVVPWQGWSYTSSGTTPSPNPNLDAYCQSVDGSGRTDLALYSTSGNKYSASDVIICKCPQDSEGNACHPYEVLSATSKFKFGVAFLHTQATPGYHVWVQCGQANSPTPSGTPMPDMSLPAATADCPEGFYQSAYKEDDRDRAYAVGLTSSDEKFVSGICISRPYRMAAQNLALAGGDTNDADPDTYPGVPVWNFNPTDGTGSVVADRSPGARTSSASGASASSNFTSDATWLQGLTLEEHLGYASAAGADLNGDDLPEVVLCGWNAAPIVDGTSSPVTTGGRCYLLSADAGSPVRGRHDLATLNLGQEANEIYRDFDSESSSTLVLEGMAAYGALGEAVAVGDINGDGFGDVILAAPGTADTGMTSYGRVYILLSASGISLPGTKDLNDCGMTGAGMNVLELRASGKNTRFGAFVVSGVDLDGDGKDELLIGEPGGSTYGQVHLLSGSELTAKASLPGNTTSACSVELELSYAPTQTNFSSVVTFTGSSTLGTLGYAGTLLNDFNNDSKGDVALLARDYAAGGSKVGAVHLWWGTGTVTGLRSIAGSPSAKAQSYDFIGQQADGMANAWLKQVPSLDGSSNSPGTYELALLMPGWDGNAKTDIGAVYVLIGARSSLTVGGTAWPAIARTSGTLTLPSQSGDAAAFTTAGVRLLYDALNAPSSVGQGLGLGFDAFLDSSGNVWLAIGEPAYQGPSTGEPAGRILWGVRRVGDDPWLPGVGWDPNGSATPPAVVWAESAVEGTNRYGRSAALLDLNPNGFDLVGTADDGWPDVIGGAVNAQMSAAVTGTTDYTAEAGVAFLVFGNDPG